MPPAELIQIIESVGESDSIDAKAALFWDGGDSAADLAKDIAAFANSIDGGAIVIGKSERTPNHFEIEGVSEEQAESFETTKVASWVNSRFSPPIRLTCNRIEYDKKVLVIVVISQFQDIPAICTKAYGDGKDAKLKKGVIYVRNANAESSPLLNVEELRELIGIATRNHANQMLKSFQAMLKGHSPGKIFADTPDQFETLQQDILPVLKQEVENEIEAGGWEFVCHPATYIEERWEETSKLEQIAKDSAVHVHRTFPAFRHTHPMSWGIRGGFSDDCFGLTRSGLFVSLRPYRENFRTFKNPWQPNPDIEQAKWLDFQLNLGLVVEFFMFVSRYAEQLEPSENIKLNVTATGLRGRRLVTTDSMIQLDPTKECREDIFHPRDLEVSAVDFRNSWERQCVRTLHRFVELFPGDYPISSDTLLKWVEKFRDRK